MRTHTNKRGFTLIELLVLIAVLMILSAIFIPACMGRRHPGRQDAVYRVVCYSGGTVIFDRVVHRRPAASEGVTYVDGATVTGDCVIVQ